MSEPTSTELALLSNTTYDRLKKLVTLVLPAFGALYFGLAGIWDLPKPEEVVGTVAIIATFLGAILGVSSRAYGKLPTPESDPDGFYAVKGYDPDTGIPDLQVTLAKHPEELAQRDVVHLKVQPPTEH